MIQFTCPCGKALHARDEYAGQTTRCPDCGRELDIPGGAGVQAAAPAAPGRPPDDAVRPSRPDRDRRDREDRPLRPATSGLAVGSLVLGLLSLFCSLLTGLPAIVLGALALMDIGKSQGRKTGKGLAITGIVAGLLLGLIVTPVLLAYGYFKVREASARISCSNNLKQIGIAMESYHDSMGGFPPAAICDAAGKPLLSWRVAILPYVEQANLYNQFKMDEPWDGPNNIKLLTPMPKVYALPGDTTAQPGYTYYRVFVGNHAAFDPPQPGLPFRASHGPTMIEFTDGTSNTILVAEAATAVPWTKPDELPYDPNQPLPPLGGHYSGGFMVGLADGSVRFLSKDISQTTLRAAITRNGNDVLGPDW